MPFLLQRHLYSCQAFVQSLTIEITTCHIRNAVIAASVIILGLLSLRVGLVFKKIHQLRHHVKTITNTSPLFRLVLKHNLQDHVSLIDSSKPFAFCFGLRQPRIYVSTALLKVMNKPELEAIILHEKYHLEHHDSLTLFIASIMLMAFPFFPVLATLIWNYRLRAEIQADQAAIQFQKTKAHIVTVLKKMLDIPQSNEFAAAAIADQTLETRITYLMDGQIQGFKLPIASLTVSLTSVSILLGIIFVPTKSVQLELPLQSREVCIGGKSCAIKCSSIPSAQMSPLEPVSIEL